MVKYRGDEGSSNSDSSSGSLKEISAEDFKQPPPPRSGRGWMGDLMRYPVHRSYGQDLYSFAWAQAVQNKPLGLDVEPEEEDEEIELVGEEELGESEKEEGEIEEGEIELGSEPAREVESEVGMAEGEEAAEKGLEVDDDEKVDEIDEFDKRFGVVLEELETITVEEAESCFDEVCSRLRKCFASLKQMFSEGHGPILDVLVQQAFLGIQTICSAFSPGKLKKMEQNKELLLRLLIHIKNQYSFFLTTEQVKEIDVKVHALASEAVTVGKTTVDVGISGNMAERPGMPVENLRFDSRGSNNFSNNNGKPSFSKLELPTHKRCRVDFSPLLNLHADYDEDSLPSPTRDNAPPLPALKPIGFGAGAPAQPMVSKNVEASNGPLHLYVTDAFNAVSSYQQKFGKNSLLEFNRLPSPTPSEDGNNGDSDIHGEVSNSSVSSKFRKIEPMGTAANINSTVWAQTTPVSSSGGFQTAPVNGSNGFQMGSVGSSSGFHMSSVNGSSGFGLAPVSANPLMAPVKPVAAVSLEQNPVTKASAKSRDPRLRFMNAEASTASQNGFATGSVNLRKHKAVDQAGPDDLKRQRNEFTGSRDSLVASLAAGRDNWMDNNVGMVTPQLNNNSQSNKNIAFGNKNVGGEFGPERRLDGNNNNSSGSNVGSITSVSTGTEPSVLLPSLLKDIAVNPTMLMQLLKTEQGRTATESQQKAAGPAVNGSSNAVSSVIDVGQNPVVKPQVPPQTTSLDDSGKIRMKPRDPRRILHSNIVQRSESSGSEQTKSNGCLPSDVHSSKDHVTVREQGEHAQMSALPSQSAPQPDISQQFTKNLQNLADIMSSSQPVSPSPSETQSTSQPTPSNLCNDPMEPKKVAGLPSQGETTNGVPQTVHPWGDVDHLLDGYDDQQKAAIQKERARRIAEQNKMFAARKLCLVLDLDHTLLNSAKFVEIDPIHEEILRKKEEQDKQRPERHLYRFPHMGMWTKLRPGVWNFLEKASQLYELHLYTMGNKLYATEMAKVLDPKGTLFSGRVISRGDDEDPFDGDERVPKSKDLDGVLGMESAVVIIDDSVRVWPHNKLNLIVVERYTYFPSSRRQFGLLGPSLLEIDHDERPEDGTLASSLGVIERIHRNFFAHASLKDVDVRNILAAEQRKILAGCRIVFSRVFPVGEANPHLHPLWQTAEQFGAECTNQLDEQVTHVVANSRGTDKVNWALSTGKFVVHPGWVEASALLYRRANEQDFAV